MENETPKAKRPVPHIDEVVRKAIASGLHKREYVQHLVFGVVFMVGILFAVTVVVQHLQIQMINERLGEISQDMDSIRNECQSNPTIGDPYDRFEEHLDRVEHKADSLEKQIHYLRDSIEHQILLKKYE